jgi:uncharacterized protein YdhG (YjbR/CyaY superfamily)
MLQDEMEEQLQTLTKQVEELRAEVETLKEKIDDDEPTLIPEAEYDFVPTFEPKVIARGIAKIVRVVEGPKDLGLSAHEWEILSIPEDDHE